MEDLPHTLDGCQPPFHHPPNQPTLYKCTPPPPSDLCPPEQWQERWAVKKPRKGRWAKTCAHPVHIFTVHRCAQIAAQNCAYVQREAVRMSAPPFYRRWKTALAWQGYRRARQTLLSPKLHLAGTPSRPLHFLRCFYRYCLYLVTILFTHFCWMFEAQIFVSMTVWFFVKKIVSKKFLCDPSTAHASIKFQLSLFAVKVKKFCTVEPNIVYWCTLFLCYPVGNPNDYTEIIWLGICHVYVARIVCLAGHACCPIVKSICSSVTTVRICSY